MINPTYFDAVHALVGGQISGTDDGPVSGFRFIDGQTPPLESQIQTKLKELQNAYPMQLLREERNKRIAETDWWASSDIVMSNERQIYRKSLRDLPSTASPKIENGRLTNVTWPTKPE
jgi:hypothetical protein